MSIEKEYNCKVCNKKFYRKGQQEAKTCSFECRNKSYRKYIKIICLQCGKEFGDFSKKIKKNKKFCSVGCFGKSQSIKKTGKRLVKYLKVKCFYCGEEIERYPSKINKKNYCNKSCACSDKQKKLKSSQKKCLFSVTLKSGQKIEVRSRWEAAFIKNFIEKYNFKKWLYEPETFLLSNGHKYTPDFYIEDSDTWIEIKGYDFRKENENRDLFRLEVGNLLFLEESVLKNVYGLDLSHRYLCTLVDNLKQ